MRTLVLSVHDDDRKGRETTDGALSNAVILGIADEWKARATVICRKLRWGDTLQPSRKVASGLRFAKLSHPVPDEQQLEQDKDADRVA